MTTRTRRRKRRRRRRWHGGGDHPMVKNRNVLTLACFCPLLLWSNVLQRMPSIINRSHKEGIICVAE